MNNEKRIVALYCRASEDEKKHDSSSIEAQKSLLSCYADENDLEYEFYVDDGYNGNTFDRPSFDKLVSDAMDGKIGAVVVTDLLRLGNNNLKTEYYIQLYFVDNDIRIIALTDGVDSKDANNEILLKAQNRLNEINGLIKIEFERLVFGNLSDEEFASILSKYEAEKKIINIDCKAKTIGSRRAVT